MKALEIVLGVFIVWLLVIAFMLRWIHLNVWHGDERDDRWTKKN